MFNDKIEPIISNVVATIGRNDPITKGIGTVIWSYTDDEGKLHTKKLNNVLYFPASPVNIPSATALAGCMKDDEGTWVLTKRKYYILLGGFGSTKYNISLRKWSPRIRDSSWI